MDPLLSHTISKFRIMFIPDLVLRGLPPFIGALLISLLPVTPINLIIFLTVLALIYATNMFKLSQADSYSCKANTLVKHTSFSFWSLIKNTYYYYLMIAYAVNLITLTNFNILSYNAIASFT